MQNEILKKLNKIKNEINLIKDDIKKNKNDINNIKDKLGFIKKSTDHLDDHLDWVSSVYDNLEQSFLYLKNTVSYFGGKQINDTPFNNKNVYNKIYIKKKDDNDDND